MKMLSSLHTSTHGHRSIMKSLESIFKRIQQYIKKKPDFFPLIFHLTFFIFISYLPIFLFAVFFYSFYLVVPLLNLSSFVSSFQSILLSIFYPLCMNIFITILSCICMKHLALSFLIPYLSSVYKYVGPLC